MSDEAITRAIAGYWRGFAGSVRIYHTSTEVLLAAGRERRCRLAATVRARHRCQSKCERASSPGIGRSVSDEAETRAIGVPASRGRHLVLPTNDHHGYHGSELDGAAMIASQSWLSLRVSCHSSAGLMAPLCKTATISSNPSNRTDFSGALCQSPHGSVKPPTTLCLNAKCILKTAIQVMRYVNMQCPVYCLLSAILFLNRCGV